MTGYDVIVVGAGCAGSATALLFARAGHRVLLADRARFPRDTLSTLYIQQRGVAHLARWGLLDRVAAVMTKSKTALPKLAEAVRRLVDDPASPAPRERIAS